ncbi:Transcription factor [Coemansia thaxteri]|uniref:Transcription factor n=1 Tax=Coemansia thaxteri TaxID=2663907 RepID=A0A9W8BFQ0_9FUNG|nr:Transcription factor [Coemansia thaxteri]KAJ2008992.1 Transcription factor [Coemansia thaxteri]KAJ2470049.1 Transcription factor [Coemansia sp. RSA 2322]
MSHYHEHGNAYAEILATGIDDEHILQAPSEAGGPESAGKRTRVTRITKKKGELLTEDEKKANHIASEQKRRQNIRTGYDQLIQIVPTLTPSQRSEALILQKTVEYIKYLLMEREILEGQLKDANR